MRIPAWVSWTGLGQHALVGALVTGLADLAGAAPWLPLVLLLALGSWHEFTDGDFLTEQGAPVNGLIDVLAFVLPALLNFWLAWASR